MHGIYRLAWVLGLILALGLSMGQAATPTADSLSATLTVQQVQAKLDALAAARDLSESERNQARELYQQAISQLEAAKSYADHADQYQRQLQSAPAETVRLQQSLLDRSPPPALPAAISAEDLARRLVEAQAELGKAQKQLGELDQQLSAQQARPKTILTELSELKEQTAAAETKLQAVSLADKQPVLAEVRRLAFTTQRRALAQEIAMLEQEQLSYDVRQSLLNAQRAVAAQDVAQARIRVQQLQDLLNLHHRDEATAAVEQTAQVKQEAAAKPAVVQTLADENAALSGRLVEIVRETDIANAEQARLSERLSQLTERMLGVRQQLTIAGSTDAIGPILLEERRNLPNLGQSRHDASELQQRIIQARLEQYRRSEALHQGRDQEEALNRIVADFDPQWTESQRQAAIAELRPLLLSRQALLEKLGSGYANLIAAWVALDDVQRKLSEQTRAYGELLERHLLWVRSGSPLNAEWLKNLGVALQWLVDPARWQEVWHHLGRGLQNRPELAVFGALLLLGLLYYRRPFIRRLGEEVDAIGDVRRDSFGLTAHALLLTALLALPWALLLGVLARLLRASGGVAGFSQGLMQGLFAATTIVLAMTFLRQLCRPRGIAIAHFGWTEAGCRHARRYLYGLVWVGSLTALFVKLCEAQSNPLYSDTLGRLVFFVGMSITAILLWRVLSPAKPLVGVLAENYRQTFLWRLRYFWYGAVVGGYALLALQALFGYYYTALQLRDRMMLTAWLLLGMLVLVNLLLRWLNISQRRLAFQRALAKREAQLAARATKEAGGPVSDTVPPELLQAPDLDLTTINEQTRGIMQLLVWLGLGFGLWWIWGSLVPAFAIFDEIVLWQQTTSSASGSQLVDITLSSILASGALLVLIGLMAHNLPGLLELVVLRRLTVDSGNRNAIITIVRYLIVGIGLVVALNIIGVSWDQVQWLVAALGVGLGFGLQEIFANFVSGLILLLERPIRVGDTVTLGNQTGTVARIHIRATTVVDWDRKEIIIPNKTFITGTLTNWNRNDPITRLIVLVRVSYESDPARVYEVLYNVATAHPLVLTEPAPTVLFLRFGSNALEFEVRVFVRELANRLPLEHELHNQIWEALQANQIEMPSQQQQEIYIRSWPAHWPAQSRPSLEKSEVSAERKPVSQTKPPENRQGG